MSKRLYCIRRGIHPQAMAHSTKDSRARALQYTASSFRRLLFSQITDAPMGERLSASQRPSSLC